MAASTAASAYDWIEDAIAAIAKGSADAPAQPPAEETKVPTVEAAVNAPQTGGGNDPTAALEDYVRLSGPGGPSESETSAARLVFILNGTLAEFLEKRLAEVSTVAAVVYHCIGAAQHALEEEGPWLETVPFPGAEPATPVKVYARVAAVCRTLHLTARFLGDHFVLARRLHSVLQAACERLARVLITAPPEPNDMTQGGPSPAGGMWWPLVIHGNTTAFVAHHHLLLDVLLSAVGPDALPLRTSIQHLTDNLRAALQEQVSAIAELHANLLRCFVLPDLEGANWDKWNKYFNNTRCSNTVAAWQLQVKVCVSVCQRCDAWPNIPQEVLLRTLSLLCGRYSQLRPTLVRAPQFRADARYLIAWGRSFRDLLTSPDIRSSVDQTLIDLASLACLLTNPLPEVVEFLEDPDAFPTPSRAGGYPHGIPAALWDSPCYQPSPNGLNPLTEFYGLGGQPIRHADLVGHAISVRVAAASTLGAAGCVEWVARRPELWDTASGPLDPTDHPWVDRLRALTAPPPIDKAPPQEPDVPYG